MVVDGHGQVGRDGHHSCRCSVAASVASFSGSLSHRQQFDEVVFDTPSWCDGSLTITPPTAVDVVKEVAAVVPCLSVSVEELLFDDIVVQCLCCLAVGAEALTVDDVEVVSVGCRTNGVEALTPDDVADR